MKRALPVCLLAVVCAGAVAGSPPAAKRNCNGLLAFTSDRAHDALPEIYSISVDGSRTDVSRTLQADIGTWPSPDGRKVAFWRGAEGLVVADPDGSNQRLLPAAGGANDAIGSRAAWSPDSTRLATTAYAVSRVSDVRLAVVRNIVSGALNEFSAGADPQWSPDGSWLMFSGTGSDAAVGVERPDGHGVRQVHAGTFVAWSPDGTRLLGRDDAGTWVASLDGGNPVEIPNFGGVAWTADGRRIIGSAPSGNVSSVAADGSDQRLIVKNAVIEGLSPDGRSLALLRDEHLVVTDLDGRVLRDFGIWRSPTNTQPLHPLWSPDSRRLLLWTAGTVVAADTVTGEVRTLAGGPHEATSQPVWAADGAHVYDAITDTTGNTDIYVSRPNGTHERPLVVDPVPEIHPVWSPDGTELAFIRTGQPATLAVTDPAGRVRTLLRDPGLTTPDNSGLPIAQTGFGPPTWSPDSNTIGVASDSGFWLVNAHTGKTRLRWPGNLYAWPVFSPDGRSLAFAMVNTRGGEDLVVVRLGRGRSSWSVHAGQVYGSQDQGPGLITDIAWSADGKQLSFHRFAVGEYGPFGNQLRVIDTRTHKVLATHPPKFDHSAVSPDGHLTADAGFDTLVGPRQRALINRLPAQRSVEISWQPLCTPDKQGSPHRIVGRPPRRRV